jgi:hypothetical protein
MDVTLDFDESLNSKYLFFYNSRSHPWNLYMITFLWGVNTALTKSINFRPGLLKKSNIKVVIVIFYFKIEILDCLIHNQILLGVEWVILFSFG